MFFPSRIILQQCWDNYQPRYWQTRSILLWGGYLRCRPFLYRLLKVSFMLAWTSISPSCWPGLLHQLAPVSKRESSSRRSRSLSLIHSGGLNISQELGSSWSLSLIHSGGLNISQELSPRRSWSLGLIFRVEASAGFEGSFIYLDVSTRPCPHNRYTNT